MAMKPTQLGSAFIPSAIDDFTITAYGNARLLDPSEVRIALGFKQCDRWKEHASETMTIGLRHFRGRRSGYTFQVWSDQEPKPPIVVTTPPSRPNLAFDAMVLSPYGLASDANFVDHGRVRRILSHFEPASWAIGEKKRIAPDQQMAKAGLQFRSPIVAWRSGYRHVGMMFEDDTTLRGDPPPDRHEIDRMEDFTIEFCGEDSRRLTFESVYKALVAARAEEWNDQHEAALAIGMKVTVRREGWHLQVWAAHEAAPDVHALPPPPGAELPDFMENRRVLVKFGGVMTDEEREAHVKGAMDREMDRVRESYAPATSPDTAQEDQSAK